MSSRHGSKLISACGHPVCGTYPVFAHLSESSHICRWPFLDCPALLMSIFMAMRALSDSGLVIIVEINSVSPPTLFLIVLMCALCLSAWGTWKVFLFVAGFEWFGDDVPCCTFFVSGALLSSLDLLVYATIVLIFSPGFLVLGCFICTYIFVYSKTAVKFRVWPSHCCVCCRGSEMCLSSKHLP